MTDIDNVDFCTKRNEIREKFKAFRDQCEVDRRAELAKVFEAYKAQVTEINQEHAEWLDTCYNDEYQEIKELEEAISDESQELEEPK